MISGEIYCKRALTGFLLFYKIIKAPHIDYEYCKAIAFCSFMDGFRNGRGLWKDESKKPIRKLYAHEKKTQQFYKK